LPIVRRLTQVTLNRCDKVIAVSHALAEAAVDLGLPAKRIAIIPDGVDTAKFCPPSTEREPLVVFVGSLIERKGVKYLIHAFSQIAQTYPAYRLAIIGEGTQHEELTRLAHSLEIINRIIFTGAQTPAQVAQWMQRARLFVLPSVEEGLGVVLLEAMASGTPCIASHVGGIPDVVSPDAGILVPAADPMALAEAMRSLLNDSDRWQALSQNARNHAVRHYSWDSIAARLMSIYRDVLISSKQRKDRH